MNDIQPKIHAADHAAQGDARQASLVLKQLDLIRGHFTNERDDPANRADAEFHVAAFVRGISKEPELARAAAADIDKAIKPKPFEETRPERAEATQTKERERVDEETRAARTLDDERKKRGLAPAASPERERASVSTSTLVGAALESRGRDAKVTAAIEGELNIRYQERASGQRSPSEFPSHPSEAARSEGRVLLSDLSGRTQQRDLSR